MTVWIKNVTVMYCVFILGIMVGYAWACYHHLMVP